uniref:Uncharacterized protein n=1 Tax=Opuntia streptacantha TaxID=393608 RepID=A0A7C9CYZ2_OPUST
MLLILPFLFFLIVLPFSFSQCSINMDLPCLLDQASSCTLSLSSSLPPLLVFQHPLLALSLYFLTSTMAIVGATKQVGLWLSNYSSPFSGSRFHGNMFTSHNVS